MKRGLRRAVLYPPGRRLRPGRHGRQRFYRNIRFRISRFMRGLPLAFLLRSRRRRPRDERHLHHAKYGRAQMFPSLDRGLDRGLGCGAAYSAGRFGAGLASKRYFPVSAYQRILRVSQAMCMPSRQGCILEPSSCPHRTGTSTTRNPMRCAR